MRSIGLSLIHRSLQTSRDRMPFCGPSESFTTTTSRSNGHRECPSRCPCQCHASYRDTQLIPSPLRPWLGQISVTRALSPTLWLSACLCDYAQCARNRQYAHIVKFYAPTWFAHIEASIHFEKFPIHFCIQTPRVVPSLRDLGYISFSDFRAKLSTREITLHDIEPNGFSVLHVSSSDPQGAGQYH